MAKPTSCGTSGRSSAAASAGTARASPSRASAFTALPSAAWPARPVPHPGPGIRRHPCRQRVRGGRGEPEELLQHVRGGLGQPRLGGGELLTDQPDELLVRAPPGPDQPAAHPQRVDPLPVVRAAQLIRQQRGPLGDPVVQPDVQGAQQIRRPGGGGRRGLLAGQRPQLAHPGHRRDPLLGGRLPGHVRVRVDGRDRLGRSGRTGLRVDRGGGPGPACGHRAQLPQQPRHHPHDIAGQRVRCAPGQLGQRGQPQPCREPLMRPACSATPPTDRPVPGGAGRPAPRPPPGRAAPPRPARSAAAPAAARAPCPDGRAARRAPGAR